MSSEHGNMCTSTLTSIYLQRNKYPLHEIDDTCRASPLVRRMSHRHTIPPIGRYDVHEQQPCAVSWRRVVEDALEHGRIDEARDMVQSLDSRTIEGGFPAHQQLLAQIDAASLRLLLQPTLQQRHLFLCSMLPTAENLAHRITCRLDKDALLLLQMGARLPCGVYGLSLLRTLFESHTMPRTINYLLDHKMLPFEQFDWTHFQAALHSPNVRLTVCLASQSPIVVEQLRQLEPDARRRIRNVHFYWSARHYTMLDRDSESVRRLKAHIDTSLLSTDEVLMMLRTLGDCWQELNDAVTLKNWCTINVHNPFVMIRPLREVVDRYSATDDASGKRDYTRFVFESLLLMREAYPNDDKLRALLSALTLALPCDDSDLNIAPGVTPAVAAILLQLPLMLDASAA